MFTLLTSLLISLLGCGFQGDSRDDDDDDDDVVQICDDPAGCGPMLQPADMGGSRAGAIGAACDENAACEDDLCLIDDVIPGGYCSKVCGTGRPGPSDRCSVGAACVQVAEGTSVCLASCEGNKDCRDGYVCARVNSQQSVCLPGCTSDQECAYDEVCDVESGSCEQTDVSRVGGACQADGECASELCVDEASTDWPGGACVDNCTGQAHGGFCDGADPSSGLCLVFDDVGLCLPSCTTSTECREDYVCSVEAGGANAQGYGFCLPRCEHLPCEEGYTCDVTGYCVEAQQTAQQIRSEVLGTFSVTGTRFEEVTFTVPANTLSFGVTLESEDADSSYPAVVSLQGPNKKALYDLFNPLDSAMRYSSPSISPTGFIYPNSPALNLSPGEYTLSVGASKRANVKVTLHIKSGSPVAQERLPLTLWFLDNSYYRAEDARADPAFQRAVARMQTIYMNAGILIDEVNYRNVSGTVASEYGVFDPAKVPVGRVIGLALEGEETSGANIFFNDQLLQDNGSVLYGISAGLPGPPALNDSPTLGVFVALDIHFPQEDLLDEEELAATMAHELGHYLGLFHLSEADGSAHDPLRDTAECHGSRDTDRSGTLSGQECGAAAATNLMFWTPAKGFMQDRISDEQRWVIHRNPVVSE